MHSPHLCGGPGRQRSGYKGACVQPPTAVMSKRPVLLRYIHTAVVLTTVNNAEPHCYRAAK